jgi:hypothetical protein
MAFRSVVTVVLLGCAACGPSDRVCLGHPCPAQTQPCKDYVNCFVKTGGARATLDSTYGPMGTCWSTTAAAVQACNDACASALPSLKTAFPDAGC